MSTLTREELAEILRNAHIWNGISVVAFRDKLADTLDPSEKSDGWRYFAGSNLHRINNTSDETWTAGAWVKHNFAGRWSVAQYIQSRVIDELSLAEAQGRFPEAFAETATTPIAPAPTQRWEVVMEDGVAARRYVRAGESFIALSCDRIQTTAEAYPHPRIIVKPIPGPTIEQVEAWTKDVQSQPELSASAYNILSSLLNFIASERAKGGGR